MALSASQLLTFRKYWIYDYADNGTQTYLSSYNRLKQAPFFSDDDLQGMYTQVTLEYPRFLLPYTIEGTTFDPLAVDATSAIYRLMRIKAIQQMLINHDFIASMFSTGGTEETIGTILENMRETLKADKAYQFSSGYATGSFTIERGS